MKVARLRRSAKFVLAIIVYSLVLALVWASYESAVFIHSDAGEVEFPGSSGPAESGIEKLLRSDLIGKRGIKRGANLLCFEYTSEIERSIYQKPRGPISCFAENICQIQDSSGTTYCVEESDGFVEGNSLILDSFGIQFRIVARKSCFNAETLWDNSSFAAILTRFEPGNFYHDIVDSKAVLFAMMSRLGMLNYATLRLPTEAVKIYTAAISEKARRNTFDSLFFPFLTASPVPFEIDLPTDNRCFRQLLITTPHFVRHDERSEHSMPDFAASPNVDAMLFARYIVMQIFDQYVDPMFSASLVRSIRRAKPRTPKQLSYWMASMEQNIIWPKAYAETPKSGTAVVMLERSGTSRVIKNWAIVQYAIQQQIATRGYQVVYFRAENLPIHEQILKMSRATVLVSMHGAGLTHAMWMTPGSVIFELLSQSNQRRFFKALAADFDLGYLEYRNWRSTLEEGVPPYDQSMDAEPDAVVNGLLLAIWMSDRRFGTPPGCQDPVSDTEAALAGLNLQTVIDNQRHVKPNQKCPWLSIFGICPKIQ